MNKTYAKKKNYCDSHNAEKQLRKKWYKFHPWILRNCYDTRCGETLTINNENARYKKNRRTQKEIVDRRPLRGGKIL